MPDNKRKRGRQDRNEISLQPYEIEYLATKYNISKSRAEELIKLYGPSRENVEKHLRSEAA